MVNKKIKTIKKLNLFKLDNPFSIEIIFNDGNILESISETIVTYDEEKFNFYLFKGIFKKRFIEPVYEFKFEDITNVEFGKYSFKHSYVKISFSEIDYLVFSYSFKIKNYLKQTKNIEDFFKLLFKRQEEIENKARNS